VENVLEHVEKMRVDLISEKVVEVLGNIDKMVKTLQPAVDDVRKFTDEATVLVRDTRKVVAEDVGKEVKALLVQVRETLDKDISPALKHLPATFDKVDVTLDRISGTLRRVDRTLAEDNGSMDEALDNLRVVTQDLRELMGQVKRYPSSALFGEAPPKKAVNK